MGLGCKEIDLRFEKSRCLFQIGWLNNCNFVVLYVERVEKTLSCHWYWGKIPLKLVGWHMRL